MKLTKLQELAIKPAKVERAIASANSEDALLGFEVELFVPKDSGFYDEPVSDAELKKIDSPDEIDRYVEDNPQAIKKLSRHYMIWVNDQIEAWVDENWRDFEEDDEDQAREDALHHVPENLYSFQNWIEKEFLSFGHMMDIYGLVFKASGTHQEVLENIKNELSRILKVKFAMHGDAGDGIWAITNDDSVKDDEGNETESGENGFNVEIISPPLNPTVALKYLQQVFTFATRFGLKSNQSTGLHINLSYPSSMMKRLDIVKLALFSGDDYQLRKFGRELNQYTWSQKKYLASQFADVDVEELSTSVAMKNAAKEIMNQSGKYFSFNLSKLNYGYLEFRTVGGVDYIHRFSDIRDAVGRYLYAMKISMDPTAAKKEYLKKLGALIVNAKSEAHGAAREK